MTILSEVLIETPWWASMLVAAGIVGIGLFVILLIDSISSDEYGLAYFAIAMMAWSIFGLCRGVQLIPRADEETYRVEALVSEDVSFIEVNEKYKFIEQRGDIYVFETKEVEEDE